MSGFDKNAADRMAAAIDVMIHRGQINPRSVAGDARLDYGDPLDPGEANRIIFGANEISTEEASSSSTETFMAMPKDGDSVLTQARRGLLSEIRVMLSLMEPEYRLDWVEAIEQVGEEILDELEKREPEPPGSGGGSVTVSREHLTRAVSWYLGGAPREAEDDLGWEDHERSCAHLRAALDVKEGEGDG